MKKFDCFSTLTLSKYGLVCTEFRFSIDNPQLSFRMLSVIVVCSACSARNF